MSGSVFWASSHFRSASTYAVHLSRLPLLLHWCRFCIISGLMPQRSQRLVFKCPRRCRIVMVSRVLLMHFVMKCSMWMVVVSRDRLNNVISISTQYSMWFRFQSFHCWSSRCFDISHVIDWAMLEWIVYMCIETLGILYWSDSPIDIVFIVADESRNSAMIFCASASSSTLRDASEY